LALIDSVAPNRTIIEKYKDIKFTSESEFKWLQKYLKNKCGDKLVGGLKNVKSIEKFWESVQEFLLSAPDISIEVIKESIPVGMTKLISDFSQLGIKELIFHMNTIRTLDSARNKYIPQGKLDTVLYYFVATKSTVFKDKSRTTWSNYLTKPPICHYISGDHFSIIQKPDVLELATIFSTELTKPII